MVISKQQLVKWLERFTTVLEENKDYLTELDAAIGDADHGINMVRGFQKVTAELPTVAQQDIGSILKMVSMTLISTVGGASGPLYGTLFLRASTAVANKQELTEQDVLQMLQAGLEGISKRGQAQPGDKTMVDALAPAVAAFEQAIIVENKPLPVAVQQAVAAAEQGMKNTVPMVAKKGRASYLGQRSAGHQDPGATSCYLMLKSLWESI
jgi:dihydroxyacetone kinase-like protein